MALNRTPNNVLDGMPLPLVSNDCRILAGGVAESFVVPSNAYAVIFSGSSALGDYWVNFTTTASVPAADVTDQSSSALNVAMCQGLHPGASISVISANAGYIVAHWMGKPSLAG